MNMSYQINDTQNRIGQGYQVNHYIDQRERMKGWGEVLKAFRLHVCGYHQNEFAKEAGVSQPMIHRIETGKRQPTAQVMAVLLQNIVEHGSIELQKMQRIEQQRGKSNIERWNEMGRPVKFQNLHPQEVDRINRLRGIKEAGSKFYWRPCYICEAEGVVRDPSGILTSQTCPSCKGEGRYFVEQTEEGQVYRVTA